MATVSAVTSISASKTVTGISNVEFPSLFTGSYFFAVHDHVIIIRTAPDDGCRSFFVLDLYFSWRFYRCSSCSTCKGYIRLIGSVLQLQLFRFFPFGFFVVRGFYRILYADFMVVPLPFSPRIATLNSSPMAGTGISNP